MKNQKGQSLVETALVLPILLMLIFGITDFGRVFHAYLTLDHAGREATRVATVGGTDDEIFNKITISTSSLDQSILTINPNPLESRESGNDWTITLTYPFEFLTPFVGWVVDDFELENTTVMRVE